MLINKSRSPPMPLLNKLHWLTVLASLVVTGVAWYISKSHEEDKIAQQFQFEKVRLLGVINERMSTYEDALRGGVAAIRSQNHDIDLFEWNRFSKTLNLESRYKGINGIGVVYYVKPENLGEYLEAMRGNRPNFHIHPKHTVNEHWPITYIEPLDINSEAVGLDLAFEKNRYEAAKIARDTGEVQITAPIILVQDEKKTPGFLQYVPIYSESNLDSIEDRKKYFVGHVYAPFIMSNLMQGTLDKKKRRLIFSVHDDGRLLYDEISEYNNEYGRLPSFVDEISVPMYGRTWDFKIQTSKIFHEASTSYQSTIILLGCGLIDFLLLMIFISLSRSNRKALQLAERMTQKLLFREKYYQHIIESSPCAMVMTNLNGKIELVNNQTSKLFGYTKEELVGKNVDLLVPARFRDGHGECREQFSKKPTTRRMGLGREVYGATKNGDNFPAEIGLSQFSSNDSVYVLATVVDMSSQVQANNELKRSNKELNDFAYVASHDLKAPLRGIIQLSNWIEEDIGDAMEDDTRNNFRLLKNRTVRLEKLLDDLLAYSRVGRKECVVSDIDTRALVMDVFDLFNTESGFELILEGEFPVIHSFNAPLEQVLRNLINNAIKHHDKGVGKITISIVRTGDGIEISVCDDGPGIALEHQDQIFGIFQTLKPRDEVEGSGMGLAIVKKILDQFESSIRIESEGIRGACFIFLWPISLEIRNE